MLFVDSKMKQLDSLMNCLENKTSEPISADCSRYGFYVLQRGLKGMCPLQAVKCGTFCLLAKDCQRLPKIAYYSKDYKKQFST